MTSNFTEDPSVTIWDKIRKLEALSSSDNPNEADNARRAAADLRRRHGIDAAMGADVAMDRAPLLVVDGFDWSSVLAYGMAEAHGCLCLTRSRPHGEGATLRLAGAREDREAAGGAFREHFQRIEAAFDARRKSEVAGGWNARDAWAMAEASAAGGRLRAPMSEDIRTKRLAAAHAAVMARRLAR